MWQICSHIPHTLLMQPDITCIAAQLSVSFFIETFIHAKEKVSTILITYFKSFLARQNQIFVIQSYYKFKKKKKIEYKFFNPGSYFPTLFRPSRIPKKSNIYFLDLDQL